jgi:hypothetical protein
MRSVRKSPGYTSKCTPGPVGTLHSIAAVIFAFRAREETERARMARDFPVALSPKLILISEMAGTYCAGNASSRRTPAINCRQGVTAAERTFETLADRTAAGQGVATHRYRSRAEKRTDFFLLHALTQGLFYVGRYREAQEFAERTNVGAASMGRKSGNAPKSSSGLAQVLPGTRPGENGSSWLREHEKGAYEDTKHLR